MFMRKRIAIPLTIVIIASICLLSSNLKRLINLTPQKPHLSGVLIKNYDPRTHTGIVDKDAVAVTDLRGTFHENIICKGWVYYAPGYTWDISKPHIPLADQDVTISRMLVRQNIITGKVQTLDLSKIDAKVENFIGIDKDSKDNIYMVSRKNGILVKIIVNEDNFSDSTIETVELPIPDGGYCMNVLYYKGFVYVSPMAHGIFVRVDVNNFSPSGIEIVDLASIDSEATGYQGLCAGSKGFIWAAPNWNGRHRHGKVLRINPNNFTERGVSIIDLTLVNPNARGYHGVCCNGDKVVLAPHCNEAVGMHTNCAIIDVNNPTPEGVVILDIGKYNDEVGGTINCENVGDDVWLFPYQRNSSVGGSESYGIITVLNPESGEISYLDLSDIYPGTKISPYDGSFDGKNMFLSPYKSHIESTTWTPFSFFPELLGDKIESMDSRAYKIEVRYRSFANKFGGDSDLFRGRFK